MGGLLCCRSPLETKRGTTVTMEHLIDDDTKPGYVIRGGEAGRERLRVLSSAVNPNTIALLDRAGIAPTARCLDLGCGGGDVTTLLAQRAHAGTVIGIDKDPVAIDLARAEARQRGIDNVDFRVGEVDSLPADLDQFDVVNARFLLSHLPDPGAMLHTMVGRCRPGGVVIVEDINISGSICWPPNEAFARSIELYSATVRARGGEPDLGPRLPSMLHDAGLVDVHARVAQPGGVRGDAKRIQLITLTNIAEAAISLGLTTAAEVEQLEHDLADHVERDGTFITTARIIQAWGRRQP